jgi:DNA-binding NtrC family response regulator
MKEATPGRILIVDDEIPLLTLMEQYLARLGYQVEDFSSAKAAFERLGADPAGYSLVIADVSLPEISGPAMIRQLLEQSANLRVLVCTGSPFGLSSIPEPLRSRVELLQKPFAPSMLAEAVRRLLEGARSGGGA